MLETRVVAFQLFHSGDDFQLHVKSRLIREAVKPREAVRLECGGKHRWETFVTER